MELKVAYFGEIYFEINMSCFIIGVLQKLFEEKELFTVKCFAFHAENLSYWLHSFT